MALQLQVMFPLLVAVSLIVLLVLGVEPSRPYGSTSTLVVSHHQVTPICEPLVTIHGYKCEEYEVNTGDGYILSMQRIPAGRLDVGGGGKIKPPVLLQHGVLVDGVTWFVNSLDESLAFILADSGFDVWIANSRGTRFSRMHTTRSV